MINLLLRLQEEKKLSYVFISHDLAVVQHLCTDVGVMYLGQFAEKASAKQIFSNPRHPYTWSLMAAALKPDASQRGRERTALIRGEPPSPINPPKGCRFAARCPFAQERCRQEAPALREVEAGHSVACHFAESLEAPLPELRAA